MVLFLGGVPHPIPTGSDFAEVMVAVLEAELEEAVLQMVSAMVSGSVSSSQIGFVLGETMRACD